MGFYLRKSVSFGGVRINFAKSGMGASIGVKGFRVGTGARGNYVHMGQNGVYYRAAIGQKNTRPNHFSESQFSESQVPSITSKDGLLFQDIESGDLSLILDSSSEELISEINQKGKLFPLWTVALLLALIPKIGAFLSVVLGLLVYFMVDKKRRTTILFYDIEEETEQNIQSFYDAFDEIMNCSAKWHVSARANVDDRKYHAGASTVVKKTRIEIAYRTPPRMKTNIKVPAIPVGKQIIYLFPDRVLIYEKKKAGGLSYSNLHIQQMSQQFIESESVPQDSTIVDQTWRYVNKSGGPDRRFKDNKKMPILLYSNIKFTSGSGLNELIQLSKAGAGSTLVQKLSDFSTLSFLNEHVTEANPRST